MEVVQSKAKPSDVLFDQFVQLRAQIGARLGECGWIAGDGGAAFDAGGRRAGNGAGRERAEKAGQAWEAIGAVVDVGKIHVAPGLVERVMGAGVDVDGDVLALRDTPSRCVPAWH